MTFLVQINPGSPARNSSQVNAAIVTGVADGGEARTLAHEAAVLRFGGETKFLAARAGDPRAQSSLLSDDDLSESLLDGDGKVMFVQGYCLKAGVSRPGD